jgi:hypothetical protein
LKDDNINQRNDMQELIKIHSNRRQFSNDYSNDIDDWIDKNNCINQIKKEKEGGKAEEKKN